MATTLYDPASGWKSYALQGRTDAAGSAVDDAGGEDLRTVLDAFFTEGVITPAAGFQVVEDSPTGMAVVIGSGSAKADHALIDGDIAGQGAYLVRMEDATVDLTVPAADLSNPRIDEVYLVVQDNAYDSSSRVLPRIAYRDGTPASSPSAPGPDAAWDAYLLVATIAVGAGVTEITNTDITDERVYSGVTLAGLERLGVTDAGGTVLETPSGGGGMTFRQGGVSRLALNSAGQWLFQGNDIITPGDVDGVDVSAHAAGTADQHEVDNSTEVASQALTGSFADVASVTLSIPAGWGSWKCAAWATWLETGGGAQYEATIMIDGTTQQVQANGRGYIGGRRTGMTTTGSRSVSLRCRIVGGGSETLEDIYLYARAVRTS